MSASTELTAQRMAFLFTVSTEMIAANKALRIQLGMPARTYEVTGTGSDVVVLFTFAGQLKDENKELAAQLPVAA
jgi:hypothetical protein